MTAGTRPKSQIPRPRTEPGGPEYCKLPMIMAEVVNWFCDRGEVPAVTNSTPGCGVGFVTAGTRPKSQIPRPRAEPVGPSIAHCPL